MTRSSGVRGAGRPRRERQAARPGASRRDEGGYAGLQRLYAKYAPKYDRRFARYSERTLAAALAALDDEPPGRLVDVACGTGLFAQMVRARWPQTEVTGVDLSPAMLERAAERLPTSQGDGAAPKTEWKVGPAEALPLADATADTLTCTNAFHLVQQPHAALAEFRRVLRPGGGLVLVDWCRDFVSMRALLAALPVLRRQRRIAWRLDDLVQAVGAAGFEVVRADRFKTGPLWGLMTVVARAGA